MPKSAAKKGVTRSFPALVAKTKEVRDALKARLKLATILLNRDELEVVVWLAERLADGATRYGPLGLDGDPRNFQKEAGEEAIDGLAYLAMESIRVTRRAKAPLASSAATALRAKKSRSGAASRKAKGA
jgi:hypothetical protein